MNIRAIRLAFCFSLGCAAAALALGVWAGIAIAETSNGGLVLSLTATTDNVSNARDPIRIDVLRWSTDADRDQLFAAWGKATAAASKANSPGAGKQGKAAPKEEAEEKAGPPAPQGQGAPRIAGPSLAIREQVQKAIKTPEQLFADALDKAPTVGHLWSSEIAGYAVQYAVKTTAPDGGGNITLVTERRLGAYNDLWKPAGTVAGPPNEYEFSVIELHLNAKGVGEGRISQTGKVVLDAAGKVVRLENYGALPVALKNVKRRVRS